MFTKRFGSNSEELKKLATIIAATALKGTKREYLVVTLEFLVKISRAVSVQHPFTNGVSCDSLKKKSIIGGNVTNKTV